MGRYTHGNSTPNVCSQKLVRRNTLAVSTTSSRNTKIFIPGTRKPTIHFHPLLQIFSHTQILYSGTNAFHGASPAFPKTNQRPAMVPTT